MPDDLPPTRAHPLPPPDLPPDGDATRTPDPPAGATPTVVRPSDHAPDPDQTARGAHAGDRTTTADGTRRPAADAPAGVPPKYEVLAKLGEGGMGVVYKVRDVKLNRVVALKMVVGDTRADERVVARFLVEARAVAAIRHPNVVQVYHGDEHAGRPYLELELCPGGSLADRLRDGPRLDPREAAELVRRIALGVAAAHARGIVHRDLKPGNVLFDDAGEPKVADFGLAKHAVGSELTRVGDIMGTPAYMAPEQAQGKTDEIGPPADVWAVGAILYECLTGARPFAGGTAAEVLAAVQNRDPTPPRALAPAVPRDLESVCLKCLRKTARDRYPDAGALAAELGRFLDGVPLGGRGREVRYRVRTAVRRWWRAAVVAAAVLFGLAGVGWAIHTANRPAEPVPEPTPADPVEDEITKLRREEVERRVDALLKFPPQPDTTTPHRVVHVDELPPFDQSAFRVLDDDRVVDLRGWTPVADPTRPADCTITYTSRQRWVKVKAADAFPAEARTTGVDLVFRSLTADPTRTQLLIPTKGVYVGRQEMKVRRLVTDVRDVPVNGEFERRDRATYFVSLQKPEDRWFGVIGNSDSIKVAMLMLFPADRPFTGHELRVAPVGRQADPVPYAGPKIVFAAPDRRWLYWEIAKPETGLVYRVDWTW